MTAAPGHTTPIDDTALLLAQSYGTASFDFMLGGVDDNDPYYRDAEALALAGRLAQPKVQANELLKQAAPYLSAQARKEIIAALYVTSLARSPFQGD